MVTRVKLIYKKNRIYRIVVFFIFMLGFLGIALAIHMQDPSSISATLSKWEYRSRLEQSRIVAEIFLKLGVVCLSVGCITLTGILHDDVVFYRREYQILMTMGFDWSKLKRMVIIRYLPIILIPVVFAVMIAGVSVLRKCIILVMVMLIILIYWSNKIGKKTYEVEVASAREIKINCKKNMNKRYLVYRFFSVYRNYGICLMLVIAIYVFIGSFCTSFVFNSVCKRASFEKNFFVNNSTVDIEWSDYHSYQENIDSLKELLGADLKNMYMFLDETVKIDGFLIDAYISDSFMPIQSPRCLDGRVPLYDNEIGIGAAFAQMQEIAIGDVINISADENQGSYLVTGILQAADMGFDCELTYEGYRRLSPNYSRANTCIHMVNTYEKVKIDSLIRELSKKYASDIMEIENKTVQSQQLYNNYKQIIIFITIVLALGATFVVVLFARLIERSGSTHLQSQLKLMYFMGIYIGKKNRLENLIILFYGILGLTCGLLASLLLNPIFNLIFSKIGVFKIEFDYPIGFIVAIAVLQVITVILFNLKSGEEEYQYV